MALGERGMPFFTTALPVVVAMAGPARTLSALTLLVRIKQYWLFGICGIPMKNPAKYAKINGVFKWIDF
jgi:hypothetical protein